jgi:D-glycero-alpha-D-manno-heptose-7-phosphate kinase
VAVRARGWCRVDLAGGTLDIWPLGVLHPGARTVNVAIDLAVDVEVALSESAFSVEQGGETVSAPTAAELAAHRATDLVGEILAALEAPPVTLRIESASPRGGGLGASSALAVALIAAMEILAGRPRSTPRQASALARDLEAKLMQLPTGRQDHYPALLGGALEILYEPGGERVRRLEVDLGALGDSLLVAYTGQSHFSAGNNWEVVRRRLDRDGETVELFDGICDAATNLAAALEAGDLPEVGRQMSREWSHRRRLAAGVSTEEIERLLSDARGAGAWGGKATGAGGGGCVAVLVPPERRAAVTAALAAAGARPLEARPAVGGLAVEVVAPC